MPYTAVNLIYRHRRRPYWDNRKAFELPYEDVWRQMQLSKAVVRWLCDELRSAPRLGRRRTIASTMTFEQQVLCVPWSRSTVATDNHPSVTRTTVSRAVRAVAANIVECLGSCWINFHAESKATTKERFGRVGCMLGGFVGCVDGTLVVMLGPRDT